MSASDGDVRVEGGEPRPDAKASAIDSAPKEPEEGTRQGSDAPENAAEPAPEPGPADAASARRPGPEDGASRRLLELVLTESTAPSAPEGELGWRLPDAVEPVARPPNPRARSAAAVDRPRVGRVPLAPSEARTVGWLVLATTLHGLVFATLGGIAIHRWAQSGAAVFEAVVGVVAAALALWSLLAAFHLRRVVVRDDDDAGHLAAAFGNLRSLFILKGIGLFLMLALSCFTFSVAAMLLSP